MPDKLLSFSCVKSSFMNQKKSPYMYCVIQYNTDPDPVPKVWIRPKQVQVQPHPDPQHWLQSPGAYLRPTFYLRTTSSPCPLSYPGAPTATSSQPSLKKNLNFRKRACYFVILTLDHCGHFQSMYCNCFIANKFTR
jgi:hypothetical protein